LLSLGELSCEIKQQQDNQIFSFTPPTQIDRQKIIVVKLDPQNYRDISNSSSIDSINNKWFINFSYTTIPKNVLQMLLQQLLQMEQNFSLPSNDSKNNIIQVIKNIKNNIAYA